MASDVVARVKLRSGLKHEEPWPDRVFCCCKDHTLSLNEYERIVDFKRQAFTVPIWHQSCVLQSCVLEK